MSQVSRIRRSGNDRPFSRRLIRLACQIFLGRRRAHYSSWLPSLVIHGRDAASPGTVSFHRKQVLTLCSSALLRESVGDRVVIIGSGPSAANISGDELAGRSALLLNGAISLIGLAVVSPLAVAVEDERFVWRHFEMMKQKVSTPTPCLFSPGVLRAICDIDPAWLSGRNVILIDDIRKPYGTPRRSGAELRGFPFARLGEDEKTGFSLAPDRGVFQGGSVVVSALQFAVATGVGEVGLLGIDISNADNPRFYERTGDAAYSGVAAAERRIVDHILLARKIAEEQGQAVVNHSPVSVLVKVGFPCMPLTEAGSR